MTTTPDLTARYRAQLAHPAWQHELRRSVRLRLALTEPGLTSHALHAALALVEDELRGQLLATLPPMAQSPAAQATATWLVHRCQRELLAQPTEHAALRHELPVTEFAVPLRRTCRPPAVRWQLAA
jgi:hypothetical protein